MMLTMILLMALMTLNSSAQGQFFKDSPTSLMIGPPPMVHDPIRPNCENFTYGNWRVQEFYSPNYPGEYFNNSDCVLYLEAPSGFRIELDFRETFVLEQSKDCNYDHLAVRDGPFAYSRLIGRYCGLKFPPLIRSSGRFLWMQFKSDDLLQYGGFKAVYSYIKDNTQNDGASLSKAPVEACRIPIKLTPEAADGVLDTNDLTLGDVTIPAYPKMNAVDCTWEIFTEQGSEIRLQSTTLELPHRNRCEINNVVVYGGTTLADDVITRVCQENQKQMEVISPSNRVFLRVYGSKKENKPRVKVTYSLVKRSVGGHCTNGEFSCDGHCIPIILRCNQVTNCKDRSDERGCSTYRPPFGGHNVGVGVGVGGHTTGSNGNKGMSQSSISDVCGHSKFLCDGQCVPNTLRCNGHPECKDLADETECGGALVGSSLGRDGNGVTGMRGDDGVEGKAKDTDEGGIPLYIIIAGAVGGAILTCVTIALCIMCRLRNKERKRREGEKERAGAAQTKTAAQRNALEMAVCNSSNTEMSLSRQNESDPRKHGMDRHHGYYGVNTTPNTSIKDGSSYGHRFSVPGNGNKGSTKSMMASDEGGDVDILMNDNSYSADRYLSMTSSPNDDHHHVIYDFDTQGIYPTTLGMTSLEPRLTHDSFGGVLHVNPWTTDSHDLGVGVGGGGGGVGGGIGSYPYSSSSLKRNQQPKTYGGLGLGKPSYYSSPESKYKKSLKTLENETIREHQVT